MKGLKWVDENKTRAWWDRETGLYNFIKLCAGEKAKGIIAEIEDYGIHGLIYASSKDFSSHVKHIEFCVSTNMLFRGNIEDIAREGLEKYGGDRTAVDVYDGKNIISHNSYRLAVKTPAKKFAMAVEDGKKAHLTSTKSGLVCFRMHAKSHTGNSMFVKKDGKLRRKELEEICSLFSKALDGFKARAWNIDYVM